MTTNNDHVYTDNIDESKIDGVTVHLLTNHKNTLLRIFELSTEHNISHKNTKELEQQLRENINNGLHYFINLSVKDILSDQINYFKSFHSKKIWELKVKLNKCWFPSTKKMINSEIQLLEKLYNEIIELEDKLKL